MKTALFGALAVVAAVFLATWARRWRSDPARGWPTLLETAIGFATNFFDTLGIGSFATTTAFFKLWHLVKDEVIPGTLNVGHTLPTLAQAFIYIAIVDVDMPTLIALIIAAILGTWLGAGVVASWSRRNVQIGMGIALLVAAGLTLMQVLGKTAPPGTAKGLTGTMLVLGFAGNFLLGALMSLGIGLYGPCLIMISLLGMDPTTAFPIMMGSCAFLMPVGSAKFISKGSYNLRAAVGLALGGIPAVLIAAYIVKSLPLYYVRWLVIVVVVYTAVMMLRSALSEQQTASNAAA
ncbi:MAG: sulfite exporter TauE/SafE family protein [Acidobacteria bacterium]|nr:sulfite exporter TauE/SafE family protein [Acidobacteriota bacterium]